MSSLYFTNEFAGKSNEANKLSVLLLMFGIYSADGFADED
jgi:hypothetical protein